MFDAEGQKLRARLLDVFRQASDSPLDDAAFGDLALDIFRFQYARNAPFAAFCDRRGRTPVSVTEWAAIPAVPTVAFREVTLVAGEAARAEATFRTSGTTRGADRRGTHYILDLALYHASLLPNFAARLLPDGARPAMLSLIPPAVEMPDSSLAHMVQVVIDQLGGAGSVHCAHVDSGLDLERLHGLLRRYEREDAPVCLLGTSFSFVHWVDYLHARTERFQLPAGSRLMDTGGYKGRSREVPEADLRAAYGELLGLDPDFCINEYGMTELCSQFYDSPLEDRVRTGVAGPRRKLAPPWARTRLVDPDTLEPVPAGDVGLLQHCDLANLGSVVLVQTEDLGRQVEDGFLLLGRAAGAQPRGCSIAMDELLEATRDRA